MQVFTQAADTNLPNKEFRRKLVYIVKKASVEISALEITNVGAGRPMIRRQSETSLGFLKWRLVFIFSLRERERDEEKRAFDF